MEKKRDKEFEINRPQKKLIFLNQFFYPNENSTPRYLTELALELSSRGMGVQVFTSPIIAYTEKKNPPKYEVYQGIKIFRSFNFGLDKDKKLQRVIEAIIYFIQGFIHLSFHRGKETLFICTNPPFLPILGLIQKKIKNRKYILLFHDIHPEMSIHLGWLKENSWVAKAWRKINYKVYQEADVIITIGRCMEKFVRNKLESAYLPKNKGPHVVIIPNWEREDFIKPMPKDKNWFSKKYDLLNKIVVLYSGVIGLHHELETLIEATNAFKELDKLHFLLIGDGAKKKRLIEITKKRNLKNIQFLPYQPVKNLPFSLTCGDVVIVTQEKGLKGLIVSCKILTALASGLLTIALVEEDTEVSYVIQEAKCGFRLDQGDVDGLVRILKMIYNQPHLIKEMGKNGREYFEKKFKKNIIMKEYYDLINKRI